MLQEKCKELRTKVLEVCLNAKTGHVSSSFSCIEIMVALYYAGILEYDPDNPKAEWRDRFIPSKAQVSPLLYTILADLKFFNETWLKTFATEKFGVHLQYDVPGVEISAGSLGMGLGIATGMAYSLKQEGRLQHVFTLMGDAECYEGSVWESALVASHNKLDNMTVIIDRNWMGATDWTEKMCGLGDIKSKFSSFGWDTLSIDGHNMYAIVNSLQKFRVRGTGKPLAIIADTVKGKGCNLMEGEPLYHSRVPECNECIRDCEVY